MREISGFKDIAPEPAAVRLFDGQTYELIDSRPHTTLDGRLIAIETWRSTCVHCSKLFSFTRPSTASAFRPNRRCPEHHRPYEPVDKARRNARLSANAKARNAAAWLERRRQRLARHQQTRGHPR